MARTWRLGTRGSVLARTQSQHVADALAAATGDTVELVIISTKGDRVTDRPLGEVGGKGLFTKEIEHALLDGSVDLAVHSMKDMPTDQPEGLMVPGIPRRADARDALVGASLTDLPAGAVVGTGSARRGMQILALRPDLEIRGIRGNVDTRIAKQRAGDYDVVVLAAAGLARMGRTADVTAFMDIDAMVPAVGQGALAVQCRTADRDMRAALVSLSHADTVDAVAAERAFLVALQGGCSVPAACHATVSGGLLTVRGFYGSDDGRTFSETVSGPRAAGAMLGADLALRLRALAG